MPSERPLETKTGGRAATTGVIPGDVALSVGNPRTELSEGWSWRLLTDVARLESGHTPSRRHPEWWGGSIPWIGIRDATSNHGRTIYKTEQYTNDDGIRNSSARVLPANTVCLSRTASVGYVVVMGVPMATSQDFVNWVCGPELDFRYLKYVLLSERNAFLRFASGTTHQTIYFPEVKAFHIAMPGLSVQRAIADVLWGLDDRIDLLRQTNSTVESIAQALFKSWFIDFDPVRAKAEGCEPEGMDAATAALFPAEFEESALGPIPKGWRAGDLARLCSEGMGFIQTGPFGSQLHASDYESKGVPVVMPQDLEGRRISTDRVARVSNEHVERLSRHKLLEGDVVFSRRGDVGRHAAVTAEEAGWLCGTGCLLVRPGPAWPSAAFVSQALATSGATDWLKRHAVGATMPNLNTSILGALPVLLPSHPVLAVFEVVVGALEKRISSNRAQAAQLVALRDTLLPRLISGKLRLPEAQALADEVPA